MPNDDVDLLDTMRRRFDFDAWRNRSTLAESLFVWNLALRGDELIGMTPVRRRRIEPAALLNLPEGKELAAARSGARAIDHLPRVHLESIWRDAARPDVAVRVDVFECASQLDAHDKVIWLLGEFESPLVDRSHGVGDVALGTRQDAVLLFARANLVFLLRNIGRTWMPVRAAALALDAHALDTPPDAQRELRFAAQRGAARAALDTVEVKLESDAGGAGSQGACRKFVATQGELCVSGGTVVYRGPRAGLDTLVAYEWDPNPSPATQAGTPDGIAP
jgi:hypothetical protein